MSLKSLENMSSVSRERLMDPNADLTDSEIRLGKGEQIKVRRLNYFFHYIIIKKKILVFLYLLYTVIVCIPIWPQLQSQVLFVFITGKISKPDYYPGWHKVRKPTSGAHR